MAKQTTARTALADAIAERDRVKADIQKLETASAETERQREAAVAAVTRAEEIAHSLSATPGRHVVEAALRRETATPRVSSRQAAADLKEAEAHLDQLNADIAALKDAIRTETQRLGWKQEAVTRAAWAVLADERAEQAKALAEEVQTLQRDMLAKGHLLNFLAKGGVFPLDRTVGTGTYGTPSNPEIHATLYRLEGLPISWADLDVPKYAHAVQQALAALSERADTKLPEFPGL